MIENCIYCQKRHEAFNWRNSGKGWYCDKYFHPSSLRDGFLTRGQKRIWDQQSKHEADFVQPHIYNKQSGKMELNPDFVKLYPKQVRYYETPDNLKKQHMPKLADYVEKQKQISNKIKEDQENVEFVGDQKKAIKRLLK